MEFFLCSLKGGRIGRELEKERLLPLGTCDLRVLNFEFNTLQKQVWISKKGKKSDSDEMDL